MACSTWWGRPMGVEKGVGVSVWMRVVRRSRSRNGSRRGRVSGEKGVVVEEKENVSGGKVEKGYEKERKSEYGSGEKREGRRSRRI